MSKLLSIIVNQHPHSRHKSYYKSHYLINRALISNSTLIRIAFSDQDHIDKEEAGAFKDDSQLEAVAAHIKHTLYGWWKNVTETSHLYTRVHSHASSKNTAILQVYSLKAKHNTNCNLQLQQRQLGFVSGYRAAPLPLSVAQGDSPQWSGQSRTHD